MITTQATFCDACASDGRRLRIINTRRGIDYTDPMFLLDTGHRACPSHERRVVGKGLSERTSGS